MREYFTIMIKENDTGNLKLLTDKLNEGFYIDNHIPVGRSTVITLQKRREDGVRLATDTGLTYNGACLTTEGN